MPTVTRPDNSPRPDAKVNLNEPGPSAMSAIFFATSMLCLSERQGDIKAKTPP